MDGIELKEFETTTRDNILQAKQRGIEFGYRDAADKAMKWNVYHSQKVPEDFIELLKMSAGI